MAILATWYLLDLTTGRILRTFDGAADAPPPSARGALTGRPSTQVCALAVGWRPPGGWGPTDRDPSLETR